MVIRFVVAAWSIAWEAAVRWEQNGQHIWNQVGLTYFYFVSLPNKYRISITYSCSWPPLYFLRLAIVHVSIYNAPLNAFLPSRTEPVYQGQLSEAHYIPPEEHKPHKSATKQKLHTRPYIPEWLPIPNPWKLVASSQSYETFPTMPAAPTSSAFWFQSAQRQNVKLG